MRIFLTSNPFILSVFANNSTSVRKYAKYTLFLYMIDT